MRGDPLQNSAKSLPALALIILGGLRFMFSNKLLLLLFYVKIPGSIVCLLFAGELLHGYKLIMM